MIKKNIKKILRKLWNIFPVSNTIVFESLNDIDCNAGALYKYLIENGYNNKYKMIWCIKNEESIKDIKEKNVSYCRLYKYSVLDKFKIGNAKFIIYDNKPIEKYRDKQKVIYLNHGFPTIKNTKGLIDAGNYADYVLCTSNNPMMIKQATEIFSVEKEKIFINGMPRNDDLYKKHHELEKIINTSKNQKVIIWMPTFRKEKNTTRDDSNKKFNLGLPIVNSLNEINDYLKTKDAILIIKIHPGQDLNSLNLQSYSNIILLTPKDIKAKSINLYGLLTQTDALITDYSSIYYDYLLLDKQIAFTLDDMEEYKLGFIYENIMEWLAGEKIFDCEGLKKFIDNVVLDNDRYAEERKKIRDLTNKYQDNKNCQRIIEKFKI